MKQQITEQERESLIEEFAKHVELEMSQARKSFDSAPLAKANVLSPDRLHPMVFISLSAEGLGEINVIHHFGEFVVVSATDESDDIPVRCRLNGEEFNHKQVTEAIKSGFASVRPYRIQMEGDRAVLDFQRD